jgi:hypothetical protein
MKKRRNLKKLDNEWTDWRWTIGNLGKCDNEWTWGRLKFIQLVKEVEKHSGLGKWDNGEIMEMGQWMNSRKWDNGWIEGSWYDALFRNLKNGWTKEVGPFLWDEGS